MKKWLPLIILAAAQFVMVLDSAVMNVSISQIVDDLDTTISGVQLAITMYTLVMAAFMLVGAKLGDIFGRDTIFAVGLAVYGLGSLITSLSPNLAVLLFGWSLVEGLGAVMVIPAIAALIAVNYEGKERAFAYSMIGGVSGAAIAAGPLIGGFVTTYFSWRYVFAGETVVVIGILLFRRQMKRAPKVANRPQLDVHRRGAVGGRPRPGRVRHPEEQRLGLDPADAARSPSTGTRSRPSGCRSVPFLILGGLVLLGCFWMWLEHRDAQGRDALLDRALLKIVHLRAGLSTLLMQQLILLGVFFVLPVYLQVVLGLDAFETGKRLFPMSVSMLAGGARSGRAWPRAVRPKRTAQIGLGALVVGSLRPARDDRRELKRRQFAFGLALFGVGAGLLVSQLGNVIISSVPPDRTNEAGGLQGTAQNLGASLGTALIGAVLLTGLTNGFVERVNDNPALPQSTEAALTEAASKGLDAVPVDQVEKAALDAGLPPTRRPRSPTRTARPSWTGCGTRSSRSRCSACSRSGPPASCPGSPRNRPPPSRAIEPAVSLPRRRPWRTRRRPAGWTRLEHTRVRARSSHTSASGAPTARRALVVTRTPQARRRAGGTRASGGRRTGSRGGSASSSRSARPASRSARSPASSSSSARRSTGSSSSSGRSSSRRPPRSSACRRSTPTASPAAAGGAVPRRRVRAAPDRLVEQRLAVRRDAPLQRRHLPTR